MTSSHWEHKSGSETKRIHRDPKAIESFTRCPGGRETRDEGTLTR